MRDHAGVETTAASCGTDAAINPVSETVQLQQYVRSGVDFLSGVWVGERKVSVPQFSHKPVNDISLMLEFCRVH